MNHILFIEYIFKAYFKGFIEFEYWKAYFKGVYIVRRYF